jgi:hypothetical protein
MKTHIGIVALAGSMLAGAALSGAPAIAAGSGAIVITSITAGEVDPSGVIPTTNGVTGAGIPNWDIATPTATLQDGTKYVFSSSFDDISYTGTCEERVRLTQVENGKKIVLFGATRFGINCSPGAVLWSMPGLVANAMSGPAEISLLVTFGSSKVSAKVPVVIQ